MNAAEVANFFQAPLRQLARWCRDPQSSGWENGGPDANRGQVGAMTGAVIDLLLARFQHGQRSLEGVVRAETRWPLGDVVPAGTDGTAR